MELKCFLIDIDGTICEDIPNEEAHRMPYAKVFEDALETINGWYEQGHEIHFFTARTLEHKEVTEVWLAENGFKYHSVLYGKPRFKGRTYHWIDNQPVKATRYINQFTELEKREVVIDVFKAEAPQEHQTTSR